MKAVIKETGKNTVTLEVSVEKEKFEEAMEKSYRKNVKNIQLPGFRKGRVPRKVIEKYYGEGIFYEDAINFICPEAYQAAVSDLNIEPVDSPDIDIVSIGKDESFVFSAKVTVKPEFELPEYKGVEMDKIEHKVLAADVNREIERMREQNARLVTIDDRPIKKGDIAVIDYEGFIDDTPFDGGKGENYSLEIGSGQFIPGFEDQLVGKNAGDDVKVTVTFPKEYHAEDLREKEAVFNVKIRNIRQKELPKKDDEFAKDVSEFETFDELKADIKNKLEKEAEEITQREKENKVLEIIAGKTEIDIPDCMIEAQANDMIQDFGYKIAQQGLTLEQYMQYSGLTLDSLRDQFREGAQTSVTNRLIIEKIAKQENIEASEEDIEKEIAKMAEMYKMEADKVRDIMKDSLEGLKKDIVVNKTLELLVSNSVTKKTSKKKEVKKDESGTDSSGADK
jgi:trigger factor